MLKLSDETIAEVKIWSKLAFPIGLSLAGILACGFIDLAFLGHLNSNYLASASIATLWLSVTSTFLWQGFGSAMSALVSQALGSNSPKVAGEWLQQCVFHSSVLCFVVGMLWWYTEPVLRSLGLGRHAAQAALFSRWRILGLWPATMLNILVAYFQAQEILMPGVVANLLSIVLDILLNILLIHGTVGFGGSWHGLGYIGSPIATSVTSWLCLGVFCVHSFVIKKYHRRTWPGWNWNFFTWRRNREFMLEQALPASIATSLEEFQIQAISFMAAKLGTAEVSAHNSLLSLLMFLNAFAYGSMNASTIRVSFYLGAGNIRMAKKVGWITVSILGMQGIVVAAVFAFARRQIPYLFTHDPVVVHQAEQLMLLLAAAFLMIALFFTAMAILQGQARPSMIAVSFVIGAWIVGVPLAYVFCHVLKLGLRGLWYGLVVGYVVTTIISVLAVYFTDWASVLEEVQDRNCDATVLAVPLLSATEDAGFSLPRRSSQCDLDIDVTDLREQDT